MPCLCLIRRAAAVLLVAVLIPSAALPADDYSPVYKPTLHITKTTGEIKVDGWLQDAGWRGAARADHFVENDPGNQIKPPVDTRAFVTYDENNLYVAVVCYDDPTRVRASLCERDRLYAEDNVGVFIDTYGDAAWAYTLNVNPYGIQADALWSNGHGEDDTYDLIWASAGRITDSGWQVEMAIPFASLRFPNIPEQTWKLDFWRHHYRDVHHEISWAAYDRNESCWACQWGTLTGLRDVKPGRGIEIIPSVIGYQSGALQRVPSETGPDQLRFENEDPDGDIALNGKYAIGSNATVEVAFNPDFSQVEADADQIDVNNVTALSFPEKRPFFQEGSDLFRGLFDIVYTRSINDPLAAAKFTMRAGRTSVAYLGAYDEHSPLVIPFEEGSSPSLPVGKSFSNIVRLRRTFGESSQSGVLLTDRRYDGGGSGTVLSADGSFKLAKCVRFTTQIAASHTEEVNDPSLWNMGDYTFDGDHTGTLDGESYWGHAWMGRLTWNPANYWIIGYFYEKSRTFRVDNGWEPRNNRREANIDMAYLFRFNDGLLRRVYPNVNVGRVWNTDGTIKDEYVWTNFTVDLRKWQMSFHSQHLISNERYRGVHYKGIWNFHQCAQVCPTDWLSFGGNVGYGDQIAYGYRVLGRQLRLGAYYELRPVDRLLLETSYTHVRSKDPDTEQEFYRTYIVHNRLSVQFSKELSLRLVVEYNDGSEAWDVDPLLTYRINPFTLFYVGTTYDYGRVYGLNEAGSAFVPEGETSYNHDRLTGRQFFMKLQYLFQI
jgi:hypothetical protein